MTTALNQIKRSAWLWKTGQISGTRGLKQMAGLLSWVALTNVAVGSLAIGAKAMLSGRPPEKEEDRKIWRYVRTAVDSVLAMPYGGEFLVEGLRVFESTVEGKPSFGNLRLQEPVVAQIKEGFRGFQEAWNAATHYGSRKRMRKPSKDAGQLKSRVLTLRAMRHLLAPTQVLGLPAKQAFEYLEPILKRLVFDKDR